MEMVLKGGPSSLKEELLISTLDHEEGAEMGKEEELRSTKAEIGEVRQENERLKSILAQIVSSYQFLQKNYSNYVEQGKPAEPPTVEGKDEEEHDLVSLRLGTSSTSGQKKAEEINDDDDEDSDSGSEKENETDLTLGLDFKIDGFRQLKSEPNPSPGSSFEETKEDKPAGESWPVNEALKDDSRPKNSGEDELASPQPQVKKARVSVRARCDAPTMNDGCQWRKYGQKIAKGNPCPRAYYRCTVAPACPVRKQVQRCAQDKSILITTYEGSHNHPLPMSATAMASTTAAAASMLLAGSSTSSSSSSATNINATVGLDFGLFRNVNNNSSPFRESYLPVAPSMSSTPSNYPTITLDLTAQHSNATFPLNQFNRSYPRYSSSSFDFSSSQSSTLCSTSSVWSNGFPGYRSSQPLVKSPFNLGRQPSIQDSLYHHILQKAMNLNPNLNSNSNSNLKQDNLLLTDTIVKAITVDPSFQSAIAALVSSHVGGNNGAQTGRDQDELGSNDCGSN